MLKYVLPVLAVAGVGLAVYTVMAQSKPLPVTPPVAQPASAPFAANVPGAGLVEPSTEYITIGTHTPGVVTTVHVKTGQRVKAGDPLFTVDDRALKAELASKEAAVLAARAQLEKLAMLPRVEDVPPLEAKLVEATSELGDAQSQLQMWEKVEDQRAISADEFSRRRFAVQTAQARVTAAKAQLDQLKAGAWKPDVEIAKANLASAQAEVERVKTDIERLTVRAPVDSDVLKVNIRQGEYAQGGQTGNDPLMILGETGTLHIRVDIDENDAWRVKPNAPGKAFVRGNSKLFTNIEFVRFEPYVIPKRSLTGGSGERVDTRVLQVIYRFKKTDLPVFVGQQMDVFLDAPPLGDATFGVPTSASTTPSTEVSKAP